MKTLKDFGNDYENYGKTPINMCPEMLRCLPESVKS